MDFIFGLLLFAGIAFVVMWPLHSKLNNVQRVQNELAARLTSQMQAVYNSLNQQKKVLDEFLKSHDSKTQEAAGPAAKVVDATSMLRPETATPPAEPVSPVPAMDQAARDLAASDLTAASPQPSSTVNVPPHDSIPQPAAELPPGRAAAEAPQRIAGQSAAPPRLIPRAPLKPVQREPNRFETAAKEVLHRIWNWIIVGEDQIPKGVSVEFAIASQWLLRIGILLLVVGVGFFLKYTIDNNLLPPVTRIVLSVAAGLVMLIAGIRILGGAYHVMGQGLLGGGIAVLYFSAFAAANFYHLISIPLAFAAMICVTSLSGFLAVRFHSKLTAILGVIGGYGTPVMLSTGEVNFLGLYGYMLMLGLGVLGVCAWKRWPLLNYLSFAGNYVLVAASLRQYESALHFWQVMPFMIAFFVLFSTMVFVFNLFNRTKSNLLDVLVLYLNAVVYFSLSYWLIEKAYGEKWVAAATLGLTAFYAAHVWYCLVRKVLDRELMLSFTALASFFLAITVPLLLSREWITVSWAVQALVILWVAGKLNSQFLRLVSYLLYIIVLGRFLFLDLPNQYGQPSLADLPAAEYLKQLAERLIMFGVPIASLALGYRLMMKPTEAVKLAVNQVTDIGNWIQQSAAARAAIFVVFGMLFLYMHLELNRTLGSLYPPLRLPVLTLLWLSVCVLLVLEFARTASRIVLGFLGIFVFLMLMKMFFFDIQSWSATSNFLYEGNYTFYDAGFRLLDFGAIIAFFAFATRLLMKQASGHQQLAKDAGILMAVSGVGMLFLFLTLELNSFLRHYVEHLRSGGVSILWTLFALAFLVRGISRNIRPLRYVGLGLFAVVTWKVFFIDLARLDQLYRIVAFIALGVLVLCGSFLYLRARKAFSTNDDEPDNPTNDEVSNSFSTDEEGDST